MRSFTSSSELRFVAALVTTFCLLTAGWEMLLRGRASATIDVAIQNPPLAAKEDTGQEWLIFGNCLVMTGVSPKLLNQQLSDDQQRIIANIAQHEQSPLAFFQYLRNANHYPDVIITNVSSWLNGTNFEQEGAVVTQVDPLGLGPRDRSASPGQGEREQAFRQDDALAGGAFQRRAEKELARWASGHVFTLGRRYHLFDYALFVGKLATSANLDEALYQLNMQSWFAVGTSETDGQGYLGLHIRYRDDWSRGVDVMAERSLQRLRLSHLLTERYWTLLEADVRDFQSHGTKVVLVRMPEHPKIREFNEETYGITERLRGIEQRTGASALDLSRLGQPDGVHLFDAVHPDADAANVITRELANWLRAQQITSGKASNSKRHGG